MDTEKILDIESDGLNLAADGNCLYVRRKREMRKYNLADMSLAAVNTVFRKDGKARCFALGDRHIFLLDFCDLYILSKDDLAVTGMLHLGDDLSSDLVSVCSDGASAYISKRGGLILKVNPETLTVESVSAGNDSSWDVSVYGDTLYAGTVSGELVELGKSPLCVKRGVALCKKNVYDTVRAGDTIYTVSQDGTLKAVDAETLEAKVTVKNAVKGMCRIAGICGELLVVADRGISLWKTGTLAYAGRLDMPTGYFNKGAALHGNVLYGSDFHSVYRCVIG